MPSPPLPAACIGHSCPIAAAATRPPLFRLMSTLLSTMARLASQATRLAGTPLVAAPRPVAPRQMATAAKASIGKKDLISAVTQKTGLTGKQAEAAVNATLETIVGTVAKGETVPAGLPGRKPAQCGLGSVCSERSWGGAGRFGVCQALARQPR